MASIADLKRFRDPSEAPSARHRLSEGVLNRPDVSLLCADQTLNNCGMVVLSLEGGGLVVHRAETLKTEGHRKFDGHERTLRKSEELQELLLNRIQTWDNEGLIDIVVHEAVPKASKVYRPESALMAAHCLRWACRERRIKPKPIAVVGSQAAKAHVCGNYRADKGEAHQALFDRYAHLIEGYGLITNEHTRDALMLGLTYLEA